MLGQFGVLPHNHEPVDTSGLPETPNAHRKLFSNNAEEDISHGWCFPNGGRWERQEPTVKFQPRINRGPLRQSPDPVRTPRAAEKEPEG